VNRIVNGNRLAGHGLIREGWPFIGTNIEARHRTGPGMAKCECGAMSDVLPSTNARKRWHRGHKAEVDA
jgi:hypothetical protein